jgi:NAD(P)-dependent dehydrogenase (short-subunit alcohol dehydrogenase family)
MKLQDKTAIVTGTGDGIGRGIARTFAEEGADLGICDINEETLSETASIVRDAGAEVVSTPLDVREEAQIEAFVQDTADQLGGIDVLVNNAAVMPVAPNEEISADTVDHVLDVNLRGAILFSKHVIPHMRAAGGGSIIHMSSVTGHNGHPGVVAYGATKGGLMALARGQAMELADDGIRVNTVSPGTVDSPMLHRFLEEEADDSEEARRGFDEMHPRGTVASIDEVAVAFVFLASDDAANVTGTDLRCDGGFCVQAKQPRS